MKKVLKYILIALGFVIAFNLIKNFKYIKWEIEDAKWQTTGFEGETENGLKQGEWKNYFKNGNIAEIVNYKNDTLDGDRIGYTPTGGFSVIEKYNMGVKVDTYKLYSGGKLNLIEYKDSSGLLQGEFKVYVDDSLSQIGYYLDDKFHGDFISYDYRTGEIKNIYQYEYGVKTG
jgi:antitoxin component YwqK of YwqJK toxin-antitoxin module